jgi:hypothetical protein
MRRQDELADPASCLNRAANQEWLFVLLGRDRSAPVAVRAWIEDRIHRGKNIRTDTQIIEAEQWIATVLAEQE